MDGPIFGCLSLLAMFNVVWMANRAAHPERFMDWREEASPQPLISLFERRLWRIGAALSALLWLGLAVTQWRYMTSGGKISVPASAPLFAHVLFVVSILGSIGGLAVIVAYTVRKGREERARRGDSSTG